MVYFFGVAIVGLVIVVIGQWKRIRALKALIESALPILENIETRDLEQKQKIAVVVAFGQVLVGQLPKDS